MEEKRRQVMKAYGLSYWALELLVIAYIFAQKQNKKNPARKRE